MAILGSPIAIAILNNRQIEIDGIHYRLTGERDIRISAVARYGVELPRLLAQGVVDLLLADQSTPAAPGDAAPYPILQRLPDLRRDHPRLKVALVAARGESVDARQARRAGACGFLLKGDHAAWADLARVVRWLVAGGHYASPTLIDPWTEGDVEHDGLTARQAEVLALLADHPDMTTYEAALRLGIAHSTLRNMLSQSYARLGVSTRAAAIARLRRDT